MNGTNYEVPHCGVFSTPHSHPSWAQIFASNYCNKLLQQITRGNYSQNVAEEIYFLENSQKILLQHIIHIEHLIHPLNERG